jgi:hypothetical protein
MHGLIFASFHDFVLERQGPTARELFGGRSYSLTEVYPDEELVELVTQMAEMTRQSVDDLLRDFGRYAAGTTFYHLYPAYFDIAGGTRPFLLTIETRIHELVRATIPNAAPPRLTITPTDGAGVDISYTSPRALCPLLEGLVDGTAAHYGEAVELEKLACRRRGDAACRYQVSFAGTR